MMERGASPTYVAAAIDEAGALVVIADSGGNCWIWRVDTGEKLSKISLKTEKIRSVSFDASGKRVAIGARSGKVYIWRWSEGSVTALSSRREPVRAVVWSEGDRSVLIGDEGGEVACIDSELGKLRFEIDDSQPSDKFGSAVRAVAWGHEKSQVAVGRHGGRVAFYTPGSASPVHLGQTGSWLGAVAFGMGDSLLAAGGRDSDVHIWDLQTLHSSVLKWHKESILCLAFEPNSHSLASAGVDRTVCVWNMIDRSLVTTCGDLNGWVRAVRFSPSGNLVAVDADGVCAVWAPKSNSLISRIRFVETNIVRETDPDRRGSEAWRAVANRYNWSKMRCGCSRGARHVPEDFAALVVAQNEVEASGRGLEDDIEVQTMLFEASVPVAEMIVEALRTEDLSPAARWKMFDILNSLVVGESEISEVGYGRPNLGEECRNAASSGIPLFLAELQRGPSDTTDSVTEIVESFGISVDGN